MRRPVIKALPTATTDVTQHSRDECWHAVRDMLRSAASRGALRGAVRRREIRASCTCTSARRRVAAGVMPHPASRGQRVATYREHGTRCARRVDERDHGEMYGKARRLLARAGRARCTCFDAATRLFRRQPPSSRRPAAGVRRWRSPTAGQNAATRHGRFLSVRARWRRRVPRVADSPCCGILPVLFTVREQPLRDGHRRSRARIADRSRGGRRPRTRSPPLTANGMDGARRRTPRRRAPRPTMCAARAPRTSSNCTRTGSARTRCSTRSVYARRPRSRRGRSAGRSTRSRSG